MRGRKSARRLDEEVGQTIGKNGDLWRITCTTAFAWFDDVRHQYLSFEGHIQKPRQLLGDPDKLLLLHLEVDGQMQLDRLRQRGGGGGR